MGQHVYRGELLGEFLVRGLVCEGGMRGKELLRLPDKIKDNITKEEIDEISKPLPLPIHYISIAGVDRGFVLMRME